ncbi:uncharacterized protein LOC144115060 [Amblyomma americanum]
MIGFRSGLSTQDAFLLLKEEVLAHVPSGGEQHLVMALDLKGAFDNVSHDAILRELNNLNCGERIFHYVQNFLSNRTATIGIGGTRWDPQDMPHKGTPQGSIISPLLFNIAMVGVARSLQTVPNIGFTLYADDITICTTKGSLATKEETLQQAATCVEDTASQCGLRCAPEKSEIIRIEGRNYKSPGDIQVLLHGVPVRETRHIRILGLWLQSNRKATHAIKLLSTITQQVAKMIRRVARNRTGMREEDTLRLVQALVVNRVSNGLPYLQLTRQELTKVNAMLRTAYKYALGIPIYTSNAELEALGLSNSFEEIQKAVLLSQRARLLRTDTGRQTLERVGYPADVQIIQSTTNLPTTYRSRVHISPIPKNMLSGAGSGRRSARIDYLKRTAARSPHTVYVDAATHSEVARATAVAVNSSHNEVVSASLKHTTITGAEVAAILLAIQYGDARNQGVHVMTDSLAVCRLLLAGRIPKKLLGIVTNSMSAHSSLRHQITWVPGHAGLEGNEVADALARGHTNRAGSNPASSFLPEVPFTYNTRLHFLRTQRQHFPPPHKKLNAQEAWDWRQLQTYTFPNLYKYSIIFLERYRGECPWCEDRPDAYHITWGCKGPKPPDITTHRTKEQWETSLLSSELAQQRTLVAQARAAAKASGVLK